MAKENARAGGQHNLTLTLTLVGLVTAVAAAIAHWRLPGSVGASIGKMASQQTPSISVTTDQSRRIVIVGGGLAGCTATLTIHSQLQQLGEQLKGHVEVVLADKMPKIGGNSAKASSGINALNPPGGDSQEQFEQDTVKSGGGLSKPELVSKLVAQSLDAIKFLEGYGVDLSKVTQLGGHSVPRSRTNPVGGNVGWSIMSKLISAVKETAGVRVMEGYKLEELLTSPGSVGVTGVKLSTTVDGTTTHIELPAQAVILATGGFAANRDLLAKHSPTAAVLATTNGPWAQGDALEIAAKAGANLRDLDQVQIHPTGFVDPADEKAGTKFLAPEKLRGVGAVLLNKQGKRFVDELATRDVVSNALASQEGQEAYLLMSAEAATEYGLSAIQFYVAKKLMAKVEGVAGLSAHMGGGAGIQAVLTSELEAYNLARAGQQADVWGKKVFSTGFDQAGELYVARVTPVVHYTMGGVEIDTEARALGLDGQVVPGLYAAGEVSGGVHGRNRLGGNSLLECAVYGSIAGKHAVTHVLQGLSQAHL